MSAERRTDFTPQRPARVLVVDDSALIRHVLTELLNADECLEVVGTAANAHAARVKIKLFNPDVITLDVEIPDMNGIQFLRNLMRLRPSPVVIVSSLTVDGAEVTLQALELGALDFVAKPQQDSAGDLPDYAIELCSKVRAAAKCGLLSNAKPGPASPATLPSSLGPAARTGPCELIGIGASTGGPEAIRQLLCGLRVTSPGVVIAQHIPAAFSSSLARRLNEVSEMTVVEARHGLVIRAGDAYIAPGGQYLRVRRRGYGVELCVE